MTEGTKVYVQAIKRMNKFVSWDDEDSNTFKTDEDEEEFLRQYMIYISGGLRFKKEARIARRALKEVAYLKI